MMLIKKLMRAADKSERSVEASKTGALKVARTSSSLSGTWEEAGRDGRRWAKRTL